MCAGALVQARMGQVIYGASDKKRGALGGTLDLSKHESAHHKMIVKGGILKDKASKMLEDWFKQQRLISSQISANQIQVNLKASQHFLELN